MYRPKGWVRHRNDYFELNQPKRPHYKTRQLDYEAGADAMLEALRKRGMRVYEGNFYGTKFGRESMMSYAEKDGWLVYIPEEA